MYKFIGEFSDLENLGFICNRDYNYYFLPRPNSNKFNNPINVDIKTRRPVLRNNTGGYSGPAIKPVAIRMVSECYQVIDIPIIGCGGISEASDVLEFMIAGAAAVEIGTASLVIPDAPVYITEELEAWCEENDTDIASLTGTLKLWE